MFRRFLASFLLRKAQNLVEEYSLFKNEIERIRLKNKRIIIAVIGAPGVGKTTFIKKLLKEDLKNVYIIDDLKDMYGKKLSVRDINRIVNNFNNGVLILSDYRAAIFLKNLDIIIFVSIPEEKRIKNLDRRKTKKKLYRSFIYRYPPIPLRFIDKPIFYIP